MPKYPLKPLPRPYHGNSYDLFPVRRLGTLGLHPSFSPSSRGQIFDKVTTFLLMQKVRAKEYKSKHVIPTRNATDDTGPAGVRGLSLSKKKEEGQRQSGSGSGRVDVLC
jgi:hypothetical protein